MFLNIIPIFLTPTNSPVLTPNYQKLILPRLLSQTGNILPRLSSNIAYFLPRL